MFIILIRKFENEKLRERSCKIFVLEWRLHFDNCHLACHICVCECERTWIWILSMDPRMHSAISAWQGHPIFLTHWMLRRTFSYSRKRWILNIKIFSYREISTLKVLKKSIFLAFFECYMYLKHVCKRNFLRFKNSGDCMLLNWIKALI